MINNSNPKENVAQTTPVLCFGGAGETITVSGRRLPEVARWIHANGDRGIYLIAACADDQRIHLWKTQGEGTALRLVQKDAHPLDGFKGKIGPAVENDRSDDHAFSVSPDQETAHLERTLACVAGLPDLDGNLRRELEHAIGWVHMAIRSACARVTRDTEQIDADTIRQWETVDPFAKVCFDAASNGLSADLTAALEAAGTTFPDIFCAVCKATADLKYLEPGAKPRPLGIDYMDRATADCMRRIRGDYTEGLACEQFQKADSYRASKKREGPDLLVMMERLESAAAAIERGENPKSLCSPRKALVESPPPFSAPGGSGTVPVQDHDAQVQSTLSALVVREARASGALIQLARDLRAAIDVRAAMKSRGPLVRCARRHLCEFVLTARAERPALLQAIAKADGVESVDSLRRVMSREVAALEESPELSPLWAQYRDLFGDTA